jgi:hypothetical protein
VAVPTVVLGTYREKNLQDRRVELLKILNVLFDGGAITGICLLCNYVLKYAVALLICQNPNLSDEKVEAITSMISKSK